MLFQARPVEIGPGLQRLQIYALGPTRVILDGRELVAADWSYAKPKELFFYLVSNRALTKEQIGQDFWPDASPDQLRRNFRATLYHLRQAVDGREWVLFDKGRYSFNRSLDFWYDAEAFESHIAAARQAVGERQQAREALAALAAAASLYRGAFVEDLSLDSWALVQRESLRQEYLHAQSTRASLLVARGQLQEAAGVYLELLDHDNLLESAHRSLMRCYARLGQRGRALRHYQELVELLADELGVEPAEKTVALYHQLQQGQEL
jgi:DNA-binding SARP family transcriptional activator